MSLLRPAVKTRGKKASRVTPGNALSVSMDSFNKRVLQSKVPLEQNQHQEVGSGMKVIVKKSCELSGLRISTENALNICMDSSNMRVLRRKRQLDQNQQQEESPACRDLVPKSCKWISLNTDDKEGSTEESDNEEEGSTEESDEGQNSDMENALSSSMDDSIMEELQRKRQLKQNQHQEVRSECKVLRKTKSLNNEDDQRSSEEYEGGQHSHPENALNVSTDYIIREQRRKHLVEQIQLDRFRLEWKANTKRNREIARLRLNQDIVLNVRMEQNQQEVSSDRKVLVKNCEKINFNKDEKRSAEESGEGQNSDQKGALENKAYTLPGGIVIGKQPVVKLSRLDLNLKPEIEQKKESTDESDDAQEQSDLSAYERKRLKNIKANSKFLKSLHLLKMASNLYPEKKPVKRREKPPKTEEPEIRRSKRLQNIDPAGVKISELLTNKTQNTLDLQYNETIKPPGPLPMTATNTKDVQLVNAFLRTCSLSSQSPVTSLTLDCKDISRYESQMKNLKLRECDVAKVVPDRIYSLAVHPTHPRFLVAAGDKTGHVGIYGVKRRPVEKSLYMFEPHCGPVSALHFSLSNFAHLLSLSYDGTIRCGDCNYFVFDEVYRDEEGSFSSFDFLTMNSSVLIVSHWDSLLSVVDRRTPGTTYEIQASVGMTKCRTVSVHPLRRELCVVAGASDVFIYDVRMLYSKKTQPVLRVPGHTRSVSSAYFSPQTGHRILTTCADDLIRVYNTNTLGKSVELITKIRHNNHTGRWLTCFRAVWDPKQESYFAVGSMERPRRIELFHEKGEIVHTLWNEESLASVCSINAFHPVRNVIVGGNSSGRVHVFY